MLNLLNIIKRTINRYTVAHNRVHDKLFFANKKEDSVIAKFAKAEKKIIALRQDIRAQQSAAHCS